MIRRWHGRGGYGEVLAIGLPLAASMGSTTLMHFTDRMFLSNYSVEAISAATPAGITSFLFISFFMGVVGYVNVFVAQYTGAGRKDRVGASLWQGIYFSLLAWFLMALLYFPAEALFAAGGHPSEVQPLEVIYFQVLTLGAGLVVMGLGLSCFYSGRGLTRPVMIVNLVGAGLNIPLDYGLINGVWGLPELGILGAGLATVAAQALMVLLYAAIIFSPKNNRLYRVWQNRAFDREMFRRLMKFGLPGGIQFFVDIFAVTFFVFVVGRLGKVELAATNIVLAINTLGFVPMIGFSIAASTMVGQAIGRGTPSEGVRATGSTLHITFTYMALVAAVFVLAPGWLIDFFRPQQYSDAEFGAVLSTGTVLLRFVALYCLFDAFAIIYSGALKGAGDIIFVMWIAATASIGVMITPIFLGLKYFNFGLYGVWICLTCFVAFMGIAFYWRFRQGKWQAMTVMESEASQGADDGRAENSAA